VDFDFEQVEGKESTLFQARYVVDPNAPSGTRVSVETASSETYPDAFSVLIEELDSDDYTAPKAAKDLWCGDTDDNDDGGFNIEKILDLDGIEVLSETDSEAVLSLPMKQMVDVIGLEISLGGGSDEESEESGDAANEEEADNESADSEEAEDNVKRANKAVRRIFKRMKGELVLDKPEGSARSFRMWLPKPMRMMLIAKIKQMDISFTCDIAPNGFLYQSGEAQEMAVSALGNKVYSKQVTTVTILPN